MTRDDIIKLAREAGAKPSSHPEKWDVWLFQDPAIERFAALVWERAAAAEREECAKVCDEVGGRDSGSHAWDAAAAIRARGET